MRRLLCGLCFQVVERSKNLVDLGSCLVHRASETMNRWPQAGAIANDESEHASIFLNHGEIFPVLHFRAFLGTKAHSLCLARVVHVDL